MTITVKKEVEETVIVKVPFASKDYCWHYLVTEEFIILAGDGYIFKKPIAGYQTYVNDALKAEPISIEQAENKITEVLQSFKQLQVA